MQKHLSASIILLVGMSACSNQPKVPPRPNGVPESAVWAGGVDGGAFVDCRYNPTTRLDSCTVYNDGTGEVWMKGTYRLHGTDHGIPLSSKDFDGADGELIQLTSGKGYLEPLKAGTSQ